MQFMLNSMHVTNGGTDGDCDCVIHETFYGKLQSCMTCDHCNSRNSSIEPFLDLSLDIPHQPKKKGESDKNAEPPLKLEDCLQRFIRGESLTYACRNCSTQRSGTKQFTILRLPHTISIHLKVSFLNSQCS
jgi:ubiquitin carboxyl-terminal hydrolase 22/27/51